MEYVLMPLRRSASARTLKPVKGAPSAFRIWLGVGLGLGLGLGRG